jgi:transposase
MKRVPNHPGRKPKFTEPMREQLRRWLRQQPDSTLAELQERLAHKKQLRASVPSLWMVLGQGGITLEKNRCARGSDTEANRQRRQADRGSRGASALPAAILG